MRVIVCLDDRLGMLFNHRRQSRDRMQIADMLSLVGEGRLLCDPYSRILFPAEGRQPIFSDAFLEEAGAGDYCFVENRPLLPHLAKIEELIVYKWNRTYPRDMVLDIDPATLRLVESQELVGSSHEKITRERYVR